VLNGHEGDVADVAFQPRGTLLASAGADHPIRLWDAERGQPVRRLGGHTNPGTGLGLRPAGQRPASGGWGWPGPLWDVGSGQEVLALRRHRERILCVAFSPDSRFLASGAWDWYIRVYDAGPVTAEGREAALALDERQREDLRADVLLALGRWDDLL